jgi:hypothetical protein
MIRWKLWSAVIAVLALAFVTAPYLIQSSWQAVSLVKEFLKPLAPLSKCNEKPRNSTDPEEREPVFGAYSNPCDYVPRGTLQEEIKAGNKTLRIYDDSEMGGGSFEVLQGDARIFAYEGGRFSLERGPSSVKGHFLGANILGTSAGSYYAIWEYSGGAHCCYTLHIFDGAGYRLWREAFTLETSHTAGEFDDLDGDGTYELRINDWSFAYWKTSFANSPAPEVILRFRDGSAHVAGDLMLKPAPTPGEVEKKAAEIRSNAQWKSGNPPAELWRYMLNLIYGGQGKSAWQFFEQAWPAEVSGKVEFQKEFRAKLAGGPYSLLSERD